MGNLLTGKQLSNRKFKTMAFAGKWKASFGQPEYGSTWIIYGESGNGKTDFCMQLASYISQFGKVFYVSAEEGASETLRITYNRHITNQPVMIGEGYTYQEIIDEIDRHQHKRRNSRFHTVFLDSIDFMELTIEQYKDLRERYPEINLIFVSWSERGRPKTSVGKKIEYSVGVKLEVKKYAIKPKCRYGGNQEFIVWEEGARKYNPELNRLN